MVVLYFPLPGADTEAVLAEAGFAAAEVGPGLGRIIALHHRSSTSYLTLGSFMSETTMQPNPIVALHHRSSTSHPIR